MKKALVVIAVAAFLVGCQSTATNTKVKSDQQTKKSDSINTDTLTNVNISHKQEKSQYVNTIEEIESKIRKALDGKGARIKVEKRHIKLTLPYMISFKNSSAILRPEGKEIVLQIAKIIKEYENLGILISGHTDSMGRSDTNEALSGLRAKTVANIMKNYQIKGRIEVESYGESQPIASNDTPEGRALNRRVEIVISQ